MCTRRKKAEQKYSLRPGRRVKTKWNSDDSDEDMDEDEEVGSAERSLDVH
jgi:hypothetical protein